ncbi:hypothetical protein PHYSODRAFT_322247 [Phytophthora sojae]|uniref:Uncharacterized protein n=1 Tax=Phytophthora sojae (strain P6497) TaxID=1094619 RepID=G4YMH1_PHYSP|nr:hypothetical protein PHYSODRAFT_322247 [Phytophthora sojae]EGZ28597.1 hypothetical protein PHYSODRAFT_322247 [Phytophthora sojae]|eukprot:XP_009515872.1 hypothetical protein PHYSODRAFT_322247 [Phytophthora sojae]
MLLYAVLAGDKGVPSHQRVLIACIVEITSFTENVLRLFSMLLSFVYLRYLQPNRPRPYRSPFGLAGAFVGLLMCGISIFAILYTSVSDTIFLASIVVTALVFIAGSVYFCRVVLPKIQNNTLGSPVTSKDMSENLLSARSQVPISTGA